MVNRYSKLSDDEKSGFEIFQHLNIFYFFKSRLCYNWVLEQENLYLVVVTR